MKFINFSSILEQPVVTADGHLLKAVGIGDVQIELLNGTGKMQTLLREVIYVPEMAFTLISISQFNWAKCSVTFKNGNCTIMGLSGHRMATILLSDGLHWLFTLKDKLELDYANIALTRMTIAEAHWKLGHVAHAAIKNMISNGNILGIELDPNAKLEFCEACAKAKSACQPFPKVSQTHAAKFGNKPIGTYGVWLLFKA